MNPQFQQTALNGQMAVVTPMSFGQAQAMIRASSMLRSLVGELEHVGGGGQPVGDGVVRVARRGLVLAAEIAEDALGPDEARFMASLGLRRGQLEESTRTAATAHVNAAALLGYLQAVVPGVNEVGDVEPLRDRGEGQICVPRREIEALEADALGASRSSAQEGPSETPRSFVTTAAAQPVGGYL